MRISVKRLQPRPVAFVTSRAEDRAVDTAAAREVESSASVLQRDRPDGLSNLLQHLRTLLERHYLQADELLQLVERSSTLATDRIQRVVDEIANDESPTDLTAVRAVVAQLEESLGKTIEKSELISLRERLSRRAANVLGVLLGLACCYLILGGLVEGEGWLGAPAGLLGFLGVLIVLGVFEALHVAAVQIRRADLGALSETHPRAIRLHSRLRDNAGIDRFLAGRQIVVILTVFFVARLSSFPELDHAPLTQVALPGLLRPIVDLGIPGALFVLWFGQLAPQFVATRCALRLVDSRSGWAACRLALALGGTALARPGFWIANCIPGAPDRIPSSGRFRWDQAVAEVDGWGVVGVVRRWSIRPGGAHLAGQTTIVVSRPDLTHITDRTMLLCSTPRTLSLACDATDGSGSALALVGNDLSEESLLTGDRRFHKVLLPTIGSFPPDSLIRLALDAEFAGEVLNDLVHVERPTRYVLFRVEATATPAHLPPARIIAFAVGDGLTDLVQLGEPVFINPRIGQDGRPTIEHLVVFPQPNTAYRLDWDVAWS